MFSKDVLGETISSYTKTEAAVVVESSLPNDLISYWPLSDVSDSVGTNTLTNNDAVTFSAGKNGNAASSLDGFPLPHLYSDISLPGNFTLSAWIKSSNVDGAPSIYLTNTAGEAGSIGFTVDPGGEGGVDELAYIDLNDGAYGASISPLTSWHLIVLQYDSVAQEAKVAIDGGPMSAAAAGPPAAPITGIKFPYSSAGGAVTSYDEVAIWSRILTSDERAELYNSGAGKFYPFT